MLMAIERPQPESFTAGGEYRWAHSLRKREHGGSMIGSVTVAAIAGSQVAVVAFIALAVVVTPARRANASQW
jgi:hypothetical protein